jgi:hypothetical protein
MMQRPETGTHKTDFRLVQSYIPFAEMVARALFFATVCLHIRPFLSGHVFLTIVFLTVYVDVLRQTTSSSSAVCMHLIPVAFMLTTADRESVWPIPQKVHLVLDCVWAGVCVMHYVCNAARAHASYTWCRLALILLCILLHMPSTAYDMQSAEVYIRIVIFYTLCFVHYHVFMGRVACDNHTHTLLGPNVNVYILFVHPYVVIIAIIGKCVVFAKMHVDDCRLYKRETDVHGTLAPNTCMSSDQELHELIMELRAAQSSRV